MKNIRDEIDWSELLNQYVTKYNDNTVALKNLIYENTNLFKQKIADLNAVSALMDHARTISGPSRSLLFRILYEYMEPTQANKDILTSKSKFLADQELFGLLDCTAFIDNLFKTKHIVDEKLVKSFIAGIQGDYNILDNIIYAHPNTYLDDPLFRIFMKKLFINWEHLESLIDKNGVKIFQTPCLLSISKLCNLDIINWIDNLDKLCSTPEEKWKFYIGWQSLGLSQILNENFKAYTIPAQYARSVNMVLRLVDKKLESEFSYTSEKRQIFTDVLSLNDFELYKAQVSLYQTNKIEPYSCPIFEF